MVFFLKKKNIVSCALNVPLFDVLRHSTLRQNNIKNPYLHSLADLTDAELGLADDASDEEKPSAPKELADFRPSGKLAAEVLEKNGVVLKHAEPVSARMPTKQWRWFVFIYSIFIFFSIV